MDGASDSEAFDSELDDAPMDSGLESPVSRSPTPQTVTSVSPASSPRSAPGTEEVTSKVAVATATVETIREKAAKIDDRMPRVRSSLSLILARAAGAKWRHRVLTKQLPPAAVVRDLHMAVNAVRYDAAGLSEGLLRLLFELDSVATHGNSDLRALRKAQVVDIQRLLSKADGLKARAFRVQDAVAFLVGPVPAAATTSQQGNVSPSGGDKAGPSTGAGVSHSEPYSDSGSDSGSDSESESDSELGSESAFGGEAEAEATPTLRNPARSVDGDSVSSRSTTTSASTAASEIANDASPSAHTDASGVEVKSVACPPAPAAPRTPRVPTRTSRVSPPHLPPRRTQRLKQRRYSEDEASVDSDTGSDSDGAQLPHADEQYVRRPRTLAEAMALYEQQLWRKQQTARARRHAQRHQSQAQAQARAQAQAQAREQARARAEALQQRRLQEQARQQEAWERAQQARYAKQLQMERQRLQQAKEQQRRRLRSAQRAARMSRSPATLEELLGLGGRRSCPSGRCGAESGYDGFRYEPRAYSSRPQRFVAPQSPFGVWW